MGAGAISLQGDTAQEGWGQSQGRMEGACSPPPHCRASLNEVTSPSWSLPCATQTSSAARPSPYSAKAEPNRAARLPQSYERQPTGAARPGLGHEQVPTGFPETYAVFLTATGRVAMRRRSAVKPPPRLVDSDPSKGYMALDSVFLPDPVGQVSFRGHASPKE